MATLDELSLQGALYKVRDDDVLDERQLRYRNLYLGPDMQTWLKNTLPNIATDGHVSGALKPIEQVFVTMQNYVSGQSPVLFEKPPTRLRPLYHGCWEFRTADIRVFGAFHKRDNFVAAWACTKRQATKNQNEGYKTGMDKTLALFNQLDLTEPKIQLGDLEDVFTI